MFQINFLVESADYLDYIPQYYKEVPEFREIANTVNAELDLFKDNLMKLLKEQYILTAVVTIRDREKDFYIEPSSGESIEFRRERLIERKGRKPPITRISLRSMINSFTKTNYSEVKLVPDEYAFRVGVPAVDSPKYREIVDLVNKLKPANMELEFVFLLTPVGINIEFSYYGVLFDYLFSGTYLCGTKPIISTIGRALKTNIGLETACNSYGFDYPLAGNYPQAAYIGKVHLFTVELKAEVESYSFEYPPCGTLLAGTSPVIANIGRSINVGVELTKDFQGYIFEYPPCGTLLSGTYPPA